MSDDGLPLEHWLASDPEVAGLIGEETRRQTTTLQLIASENFVSPAVLAAAGSVLTNKYSEGYPGRRYYGGNRIIDEVEDLARDRMTALFGADHANVQPHAGANANLAAYQALLQPGDTVLAMQLDHGGHLTHGSPASITIAQGSCDTFSYPPSENSYDWVTATVTGVRGTLDLTEDGDSNPVQIPFGQLVAVNTPAQGAAESNICNPASAGGPVTITAQATVGSVVDG